MTPVQIATLNELFLADPTASQWIHGGDEDQLLADWFNEVDSNFWVWKSSVLTQDVFDLVIWANMTPSDAPDGTQLWENRNLQCQSKQLNVQTLLRFDFVNCSKVNIRAGLKDALTHFPSGNSGADKSAGWTDVDGFFKRVATRAEKALAIAGSTGGDGTNALPKYLTYEGEVAKDEASTIRAL